MERRAGSASERTNATTGARAPLTASGVMAYNGDKWASLCRRTRHRGSSTVAGTDSAGGQGLKE